MNVMLLLLRVLASLHRCGTGEQKLLKNENCGREVVKACTVCITCSLDSKTSEFNGNIFLLV